MVGEMVGGHLDGAAFDQTGADEFVESGSDEAAFVMAFFGPRVGEEEVEGLDAFFGEHPGEGKGCFEAQDAHILEVVEDCFLVDGAYAVELSFNAEELGLGMVSGVGYEEAAFAATDVDLDGARRIEDGIKGQGPVDVGVVDDEGFVVFWEHG